MAGRAPLQRTDLRLTKRILDGHDPDAALELCRRHDLRDIRALERRCRMFGFSVGTDNVGAFDAMCDGLAAYQAEVLDAIPTRDEL